MRLITEDKQKIFNLSCAALREMKERATDHTNGSCKYITTDGRHCLVGNLMPWPNKMPEGYNVKEIKRLIWDGVVKLRSPALEGFLSYLQEIHDSKYNWRGDKFFEWSRMEQLATIYNLDSSEAHA